MWVYFGSWFRGPVHPGGASRQQEPEAGSHMTFIIRKQMGESMTVLSLLCTIQGPLSWRGPSQVVLESVKLTMSSNYNMGPLYKAQQFGHLFGRKKGPQC